MKLKIMHIGEVQRISEEEPNEYLTAFASIRILFTIAIVALSIIFRNYFANLNDSGDLSG